MARHSTDGRQVPQSLRSSLTRGGRRYGYGSDGTEEGAAAGEAAAAQRAFADLLDPSRQRAAALEAARELLATGGAARALGGDGVEEAGGKLTLLAPQDLEALYAASAEAEQRAAR